MECNSRKGETVAGDFLRWLYRESRLTASELTARLRALDALASGKLRPLLPASQKIEARKRGPRVGTSLRSRCVNRLKAS